MEGENKLHSVKITRANWKMLCYGLMIIGVIVMSYFNSTFSIPLEYMRKSLYGAIGGILAGFGLGLAYSRIFRIEEIDD